MLEPSYGKLNSLVGLCSMVGHLQDANAYVVCREDRAFLCRRCDISIHSATKLAQKHQRFLLTGVTIALQSHGSNNSEESASAEASDEDGKCGSEGSGGEPSSSKSNNMNQQLVPDLGLASSSDNGLVPDLGLASSSDNGNGIQYGKSSKFDKNMATSVPHWRVDELLDIPGLADGYCVGDTDAILVSHARLAQRRYVCSFLLHKRFLRTTFATRGEDLSMAGTVPRIISPRLTHSAGFARCSLEPL
eukprot:1187516-Prorocentrum_minimum.AAC.1